MMMMNLMLIGAEGQPVAVLGTSNAVGKGQTIEISDFSHNFWYPITFCRSQQRGSQAN